MSQQWSNVVVYEGEEPPIGERIQSIDVFESGLYVTGGFEDSQGDFSLARVEEETLLRMIPHNDGGLGKSVAQIDSGFCVVGNMDQINNVSFFNDVGIITNDSTAYQIPNVLFQEARSVATLGEDVIIAGNVLTWNGNLDYVEDLGVVAARVVAYDGDSARFIGTPLGSFILDLTVFQDNVYATGALAGFTNDMTIEGLVPSRHIMRYDGSQWHAVDTGVDDPIRTAFSDSINDLLYIGGDFSSTLDPEQEILQVASWDGNSFAQVGEGLPNGTVLSLCMYRNQLYAGGVNLIDNYDLVYFNGAEWKPVDEQNGGIQSESVRELCVFQDHLYISGNFQTVATNITTNGFVKYFLHPDSIDIGRPNAIVDEQNKEEDLLIYPNPSDQHIQIQIGSEHLLEQFSIIDLNGKNVIQGILDKPNFQLSIAQLPAGQYIFQIANTEVKKRFVVER